MNLILQDCPRGLLGLYEGDCRDMVLPSPADLILTAVPYIRNEQAEVDLLEDILPRMDSGEWLADNGVLCLIDVADYYVKHFIEMRHISVLNTVIKNYSFRLYDYRIWNRSFKHNIYRIGFSHVFVFTKNGQIPFSKPTVFGDVFEEKATRYRGFSDSSPAQFVRMLIEAYSQQGDLVFDPFAGTGTVAFAAAQAGRQGIGCDIDIQNIEKGLEKWKVICSQEFTPR